MTLTFWIHGKNKEFKENKDVKALFFIQQGWESQYSPRSWRSRSKDGWDISQARTHRFYQGNLSHCGEIWQYNDV